RRPRADEGGPAPAWRSAARAGGGAEPDAARLLARRGTHARAAAEAHRRHRGGGRMTRPALFLLLAIAACASDRGISHRSTPADPSALQAEQSLGGEAPSGEWPAPDWWKRYGDPQLDALVGEALAGSPNMRLAQARLDQARAQAQVAGASLKPQLNAEASVNRQRFSENYIFPPPIGGSSYTTTQLDVNARYDIDFWGRNRAAYEAAVGRSRAAQAES